MPRFSLFSTDEQPQTTPAPPPALHHHQQHQQYQRSPFAANAAARRMPEPSSAGRSSRRSTPQRKARGRENVSLPRLLTCLAPNGRSILSLLSQKNRNQENLEEFFIEWQPLPLDGNKNESNELAQARNMFQSPSADMSKAASSTAVKIVLPDHVQESLRRHAPLELICVNADPSSSSFGGGKSVPKQAPRDSTTPDRLGRSGANMTALPILCVYTSKEAFLLELAVSTDASPSKGPQYRSYGTPITSPPPGTLGGKVLSVTEPFESDLLDASCSTRIVRIRPAPQFRMGYETLCRARAMAMLTYDRESNRYALTLYHGRLPGTAAQQPTAPFTTQPLAFGMEYSVDEQDLITDFSFAQSEGLSLFSSMSALFLQESGNILCASPILFDGTVVARESVQKCLTYLHEQCSSLEKASPKWKQCKAAEVYFVDVFGEELEKTKNAYLTARVQALIHRKCAVQWPLAIQGPILAGSTAHDESGLPAAVSLEPFFSPNLVGLALGRVGRGVDLAILSPSALVPRFSFENPSDRSKLDASLQQFGVLVDRIVVDSDPDNRDGDQPYPVTKSANLQNDVPNIIADPVVNTILHSVSADGVTTISTNVMHVTSQEICGDKENDDSDVAGSTQMEKRTTAWSSLNVTSVSEGNYLQGVVVTRDALVGHVMLARLSNGSVESVNITEARSLYDMEAMPKVDDSFDTSSNAASAISNTSRSTSDAALSAVEAIPPLYDLVEPLVKKIAGGLASMGKVVGSETASKDITPEMLATVVAVKERCDREIVLPLLELREVTATRHKELQSMYKRQKIQMESLRDMVQSLTERMEDLTKRMETVESNSVELSGQAARIFQASQDLQPTITQAEQEYYDLLKGLETKCAEWKEKLRALEDSSAILCDAVESGRAVSSLELPPELIASANDLLIGEAQILKDGKVRLEKLDGEVARLSGEVGL